MKFSPFLPVCSRSDDSFEIMIPQVQYSEEGDRVVAIELFGDYVVRQLGVPKSHGCAASLATTANDYLRGNKTMADDSREKLLALVEDSCAEVAGANIDDLAKLLVDELDSCMLAYFSFHWQHAGLLMDQAIRGIKPKRSFKEAVRKATSSMRVEKVLQHLGTQRRLSLLLDEARLLSSPGADKRSVPKAGEVLVPADQSVRSPVLLLIGGGMGAGKSTVVKEIMKTPFWSKVSANAVVVEADAFKEKDVVYQALLAEYSADVAQISQLVHESSTNAASGLLVTALNEGRDVIFDGTMSWAPFVTQTIEMARAVHRQRFRMGPGYQKLPEGGVLERYWDPIEGDEEDPPPAPFSSQLAASDKPKMPYRIEVVGVICDAPMAVMRGMRRAILTGRGVPVGAQLRSHRLFSESMELYASLVDKATIYSTTRIGEPAELVAYKESDSKVLYQLDALVEIRRLQNLNSSAKDVLDLYSSKPPHSWILSCCSLSGGEAAELGLEWKRIVESTERLQRQELLRAAFLKLKACALDGQRNGGRSGVPEFFKRDSSLQGFSGSQRD